MIPKKNLVVLAIQKEKVFLLLLFMISFVSRAAFFVKFLSNDDNPGYMIPCDSSQYQNIALHTIESKNKIPYDKTEKYVRLPGYPLFLAVCYTIFGENKIKALWVQIIIASIIPILIFLLSLTLFPSYITLAKFSAGAVALHVPLISLSGCVMTETIFMFFFQLFLLTFLPSFSLWFTDKERKYSLKKLFVCGILLGICSIIRPVGHIMLIPIFLLLLLSNFFWKQKIKGCAIFFTGWFLVIFFLLFKHYKETGYIFFHSLSGAHFVHNTTTSTVQQALTISWEEAHEIVSKKCSEKEHKKEVWLSRPLNGYELCIVAEEVTKEYFKKYPFIMISHFVMNMVKSVISLQSSYLMYVDTRWTGEYSSVYNLWDRMKPYFFPKVITWWLIPLIYYEIIYLFLMLVGVIFFFIGSFFDNLVLGNFIKMFVFVMFFVVISFGCGHVRMRVPADPLLIIMAGFYWIRLVYEKRSSQ
jgi:hypothetical protein